MTVNHSYFADMEARIPKDGVRTRFAPSPTGSMHVGNLRTALYAYLIARKKGGKYLLRVEDTDQNRYVEGALDLIYKTLTACGLVHDEGPDIGGPVGPYVQSHRRELYGKYAALLVERGGAYPCFCDKDDGAPADDKGIKKYDGRCARLAPQEVQEKLDAHTPHVIRQRIPAGSTSFSDVVFGEITVDNGDLDEGILMKSDGLPTYNFANVVDDHLMGITHVVRGSEYLSSTPKYNLLYTAFGWEVPVYIHCSPVMRDATNKLSKRHGDPSYEDLIAGGYLAEAVVNYVALLGWSPGGEEEIFSLKELCQIFDVAGISKSPAIFDIEKLKHFNSAYIRALPLETFHQLALPYIRQGVKNPAYDTQAIAALLQARCEVLVDIPEKLDFFDALPAYDKALYVHKKSKTDEDISRTMLAASVQALEGENDWSDETLQETFMALASRLEVKNATLMYPVRIAVAGKAVTPGGAVELCAILGKEETLRRLKFGLEKLG